jgi:glycosyltransferase involved in cell wall biosynthesis
MKILWVYSDFLHPTTRGGQIRTLEMLKRIHTRHEVHYAGMWTSESDEGPRRASEYASCVYSVKHRVPGKASPGFAVQLVNGLFNPMPVAVFRYSSEEMRLVVDRLLREHGFDAVVCDFLSSAQHFRDLSNVVLFQHNVEAVIWRRHVENAESALYRPYFKLQANRMREYESQICRSVRRVIAVSEADSATMRKMYGVSDVCAVPTGVDVEYFAPIANQQRLADLVFLGSMDWMPNIDGISWFVRDVLPLIRARRPDCSLAIVGRKPVRAIQEMAVHDSGIQVTGTVPDVRPWLWGGAVSIVPLHVGGGTRIKIYEAMAARIPVVSTTIGAEGLAVTPSENILIADTPEAFAEACVRLLEDAKQRERLAATAYEMVAAKYSWDSVAREFEALLR